MATTTQFGAHRILAEPTSRGDGLAVDSIAAIDHEYDDPNVRARVEAMIVQEMQRMASEEHISHDSYLSGTAFESCFDPATQSASELVRNEMQRMLAGGSAAPRLDARAHSSLSNVPETHSPSDWQTAVDRAKVALEAQSLRTINLELANKYSVDTWKSGGTAIEAVVKSSRTAAAAMQQQEGAVDAARVSAAAPHAAKLSALARRYAETVDANFSTELACVDAEREVKRLRAQATRVQEQQAGLATART